MGAIRRAPLPTFHVWVDAQLPPALARWLREAHGIDAIHVQDLGLHRAPDPLIFQEARSAGGTIVVLTKDDDFPKLLTDQGAPPHVAWVRCGNASNQELRRIVIEAWPRAAALFGDGEPLVEIRRRHDLAS